MLLASLREDERAVYVPNPMLTPAMLRLAVARELGLDHAELAQDDALIDRIQRRLLELAAAGRRIVVCLDEAQAMPDETLEALRLLTNLETEKRKLLQVVLFGQPELEAKLQKPELRQVRQRIAWSFRLQPLAQPNVEAYINHRLERAGYKGRPLFTPAAMSAMTTASGGVPRLINVLCHKALMLAYGRGDAHVSATDVERAASDTDGAAVPRPAAPLLLLLAGGVALLLGLWTFWQGTL